MDESPLEELAIWLHEHFCREDHADSCWWHYELTGENRDTHIWSESAHARWLGSARNMMSANNLQFRESKKVY